MPYGIWRLLFCYSLQPLVQLQSRGVPEELTSD